MIASIAASLIKFGVLKSGSPKLRPIISFPSALNSLVLAAIAKVWDTGKLLILSDNGCVILVFVVVGCFSYANSGFLPKTPKCLKCSTIALRIVSYSLYGKLNSLAVSFTILANLL